MALLEEFDIKGRERFTADPKKVPAARGETLKLNLKKYSCKPHVAGSRSFTPEETEAIQLEVMKLYERGIIEPSTSLWAAVCVTVRKKEGTLRLCQDYRRLNYLRELDSGGLGDMQRIFGGLKGIKYFTSINLASGFFHLSIQEGDRHLTAFCDARGHIWQYKRCRFGFKVLPAKLRRLSCPTQSYYIRTGGRGLPFRPTLVSWLEEPR